MALWTPEYRDTAFWFDGLDGGTVTTVSGAVSEFVDKSGNGRHAAQSDPAKRPGYDPESGRVQFTGFTQALIVPGWASGTNHVLFAVVDPKGTGGLEPILTAGSGLNASNNLLILAARADLADQVGWYSGTWYRLGANTAGLQILEFVLNGSTGSLYRNGILVGSAAYAGRAMQSVVAIGDWPGDASGDSRGYIGDMKELVLLSTATLDERQQMQGYLAHRHGLAASLPAEHPYKIAAPTYGFFHGTITDKDGNPAERRITVLDATGHCVATDTSDPVTGAYSIYMPNDDPYTLAFDGEPDRNAQVFANVIPGEPPA